MGRLDGKVAVITGGASGIGAATVRLFVEEGACVVIGDIQDDPGHAFARSLGETARYQHADVRQEPEVKKLINVAVREFGRLDCLFNNAGFGQDLGGVEEISVEQFDNHIAVLLRGVFLGMKHAAPVMKRQAVGSIINTASVAGLRAGCGNHAYSAAKSAVIHLTRSVAMELGESGVRVNAICPGGIATPIYGKAFGVPADALDQSVEVVKGVLAGYQPIRRPGLPEDIARAALWLASDDSSFVTGHALVVDGGGTAGRLWSDSEAGWAELRAALGVAPRPA